MKANLRTIATRIVTQLQRDGESLQTMEQSIPETLSSADRGLVKALVYGFCRHYWSLQAVVSALLSKPLKNKDRDIQSLLMLGVFQLQHLQTPAHAALSETVESAKQLKKPWASKLVNACLRQYLRQKPNLKHDQEIEFDHPKWLISAIKTDYPADYAAILSANNLIAPLTLRVNRLKTTRSGYQALLKTQGIDSEPGVLSPDALILSAPHNVASLPHFAEGWCSVQDEAAQLCGQLLELAPQQKVLDACAAPGGKSGHMLEIEPTIELSCVEIDAKRSQKIGENLQRLGLQARVHIASVEASDTWWDGQAFDRILADVPCSATGVIRRHPDIKLLRQQQDINKLAEQQLSLLKALWLMLKPGGILLYSTCSVLAAENEKPIAEFVNHHGDAQSMTLPLFPASSTSKLGHQNLPGDHQMDGFYYCKLRKLKE